VTVISWHVTPRIDGVSLRALLFLTFNVTFTRHLPL